MKMGYTQILLDIIALLKTYWIPCPALATYKFPKQKNRVIEILKENKLKMAFIWFWVEKHYSKKFC